MIELLKEAIRLAKSNTSRLPSEVLNLKGATSLKIRHLLNNVCRDPGTRYLEIGLWKGATFGAAIYSNPGYSVGIDRFDTRLGPKRTIKDAERHLWDIVERFGSGHSKIICADCFDMELDVLRQWAPFNVYFYDGSHLREDQAKALTSFASVFDDEIVYMVDDWNRKHVRKGTREGLNDIDYDVIFEHTERTPGSGYAETWWNGFYACVLRKK